MEIPVAVRIIRIDQKHPLYEQEIDLRERVLLRPIGLDFEKYSSMFEGHEERFRHIVAAIDHPTGEKVVGCVLLVPDCLKKGIGKLSQMAVDPQRQHEGLGRQLIAEFERIAFGELGLREIFCEAQATAVGFYEKMGWSIEGEKYQEAGIDHYNMVFRPDPSIIDSVQTIETDLDNA